MDGPQLEVGRHPRGVVEVGAVAPLGVVAKPVATEGRPRLQGRRLTGRGERRVGGGVVRYGLAGDGEPLHPGGVRRRGGAPAVRGPGAVERGEDLVRRPVGLEDAAGRDGVRAAGGHQRHVAEGLLDPAVPACPVGAVVGADLHGAGADLAHERGHDVLRAAAAQRQRAAVLAQVGVEGPERSQEEGGPGGAAAGEEGVVEDEQGGDGPLLCRGQQRWVVAQPQVSAEPDDRRPWLSHGAAPCAAAPRASRRAAPRTARPRAAARPAPRRWPC